MQVFALFLKYSSPRTNGTVTATRFLSPERFRSGQKFALHGKLQRKERLGDSYCDDKVNTHTTDKAA